MGFYADVVASKNAATSGDSPSTTGSSPYFNMGAGPYGLQSAGGAPWDPRFYSAPLALRDVYARSALQDLGTGDYRLSTPYAGDIGTSAKSLESMARQMRMPYGESSSEQALGAVGIESTIEPTLSRLGIAQRGAQMNDLALLQGAATQGGNIYGGQAGYEAAARQQGVQAAQQRGQLLGQIPVVGSLLQGVFG